MKAKFSVFGVCAATLLPIAFACSGDDGLGKINVIPDASIDAMEPCLGQSMYSPAFGSDNTEAYDYPSTGSGADTTPHEVYFIGYLDNNDPGDYLYIDMFAGFGAFSAGDIVPGNYPLVDDDTAYSTCGACVYIGAQVDSSTGDVGNYYFATGGVLNLTSTMGRLKGSLQNVDLHRVTKDVDGNPSDDSTHDCVSHIDTASFDTVIAPGSGSGSAAPAQTSATTLTRRSAI